MRRVLVGDVALSMFRHFPYAGKVINLAYLITLHAISPLLAMRTLLILFCSELNEELALT